MPNVGDGAEPAPKVSPVCPSTRTSFVGPTSPSWGGGFSGPPCRSENMQSF